MREWTFGTLGEFRDVLPKLATASNHDVYVDVGDGYGGHTDSGGEARDPNYPVVVDRQAIWNDRDNCLAYMGSDEYTITQHSEILDMIDSALGHAVGEIGIGHVRDYGEFIDGFATLEGHNIDVMDLCGDGYVPPARADMADPTLTENEAKGGDGWVRDRLGVGIRFQNSFDGSEKLALETMGYRFICQNWLLWGEEEIGSQKMVHVNALDSEMVEDLIFDVMDNKAAVEEQIITAVDEEFPIETAPNILSDSGFGVRYANDITELLLSFGVGDHISRWDIYNAATQYLDHQRVDELIPSTYQRYQGAASHIFAGNIGNPEPVKNFEEVYA